VKLPILFIPLLLTSVTMLSAQQNDAAADSIVSGQPLEEVVISATKTLRSTHSLGVPVTVIKKEDIRKSGSNRLSDVLAQQAGLVLTHDHGTGIQLQGMDPDYTMILINGQPLTGRTAGTLELDRITLSNVVSIEVVRGPSSCLYGSDALAGIINIITDEGLIEEPAKEAPKRQGSTSIEAQYRRFNTTNLSLQHQQQWKNVRWNLFANGYGSSGYDLTPETYGKTGNAFGTGTLENRVNYKAGERVSLAFYNRSYIDRQWGNYYVQAMGIIDDSVAVRVKNTDINSSIITYYNPTPKMRMSLTLYHQYYSSSTRDSYESTGALLYEEAFKQHFTKEELNGTWTADNKNALTYGGGLMTSRISAERYNQPQSTFNYYLFLQHEWLPGEKINLTAGLRWDGQREFGQQVNPKLSFRYDPVKSLTLRLSGGTGFKAPDSRQLFLNFTNPLVGYTVIGHELIEEELSRMEAEGLIQERLVQISNKPLKSERSYAGSVGFTYKPVKGLELQSDAYYNHVYNLLETQPFARKTNGQFVYSYYNINAIFTTGLHSSATYRKQGWVAKVVHEYLRTGDYDMMRQIRSGQVFRRNPETFATERVSLNEYGGLFNRSRHTASASLTYTHPVKEWFVSARATYRSRYGFMDINGNMVPDISEEYVSGYAMFYLSGGTSVLKKKLQLSAGIDNLGNFTSPEYIPSISGILPWIQVRYTFSKS